MTDTTDDQTKGYREYLDSGEAADDLRGIIELLESSRRFNHVFQSALDGDDAAVEELQRMRDPLQPDG